VCVLARVFEEAGLTTLTIAMVREHAEKVKAPRVLFVPFPFGYALGKPNDPQLQHRVIGAAIDLLQREQGPVLEDFPEEEAPEALVQASGVQQMAAEAQRDPADEVTTLRAFYERWLEDHGGRTTVGLCGIPQRRWRGVVRFLESYSRGEDADMRERPAHVPVPQFIRYCVDDLKAFYYEARMAQRANASESELHRWFWGETAMAQLIRAVAQRMNASDDPALKYFAYGLAR
jgi:AraC-like DNA-binding protein